MLIVKVYVNEREIDRLHIQNVQPLGKGLYEYRCVNPPLEKSFFHKRSAGYEPLLIKVLQELQWLGRKEEQSEESG